MSERTEVNTPCQMFLAKVGLYAWPNNTGSMGTPTGYISFGWPGSPDIICILPNGVFCGIECKTAKGKQSDGQKNFQRMVEKNRGLYFLVRSVDDLIEQLMTYVNSLPDETRSLFHRLLAEVSSRKASSPTVSHSSVDS